MNFEQLEQRKIILDAAMALYMSDKKQFTIRNIAISAQTTTDVIYQFYSTKDEILRDFYNLIPHIYRHQIREMPEYQELMLADRISNFIYTFFDMLQEQRHYVDETFNAFILSDHSKTFRNSIANMLREILDNDPRVSDLNRVVIPDFTFQFASSQFISLLQFWMNDNSEGAGKTLAFVEKLTVFTQEVMYSDIIGKGLDLGRYTYSHIIPNQLWIKKIHQLPCFKK